MKILVAPCLLLCSVYAHGFTFLSDDRRSASIAPDGKAPKKGAEEAPAKGKKDKPTKAAEGAAPAEGEKTKPLEGPAHNDNFQDEVVDQADPEFGMYSGGDNCITFEEAKKPFDEQMDKDARPDQLMTEDQKEATKEWKEEALQDLKMMYDHADKNHDGCLDQAEFKAAGEMEGPPPGFEKESIDKIQEESDGNKTADEAAKEFEEQMANQEKLEFDAMDTNGDHKVSQAEAYAYASERLPEADIDSTEMDEMFNDADLNGDKFLTFEEFIGAGKAIEGDGKEMEKAAPMDGEFEEVKAKPEDEGNETAKGEEKKAGEDEAKPTGDAKGSEKAEDQPGDTKGSEDEKAQQAGKGDDKAKAKAKGGAKVEKKAEPMALKIYAARKGAWRASVQKKLLAHKPPFKVISSFLQQ